MNRKKLLYSVLIAGGVCAVAGTIATAQPAKDEKAPTMPEMQLPPGWTEADMQACMVAATPGEMHKFLARSAGKWKGKTTMWMYPGAEPMNGECTSTMTPIMDGRYLRCEMKGDMPGMGPFEGYGIYGYDNVSKKFVSTWIDNYSTGIMNGTGDRSAAAKTITWEFEFNCPVTKKSSVMREIEKFNGPNSKTLEMHMPDPKTGEEFKMMMIEFTREAGS